MSAPMKFTVHEDYWDWNVTHMILKTHELDNWLVAEEMRQQQALIAAQQYRTECIELLMELHKEVWTRIGSVQQILGRLCDEEVACRAELDAIAERVVTWKRRVGWIASDEENKEWCDRSQMEILAPSLWDVAMTPVCAAPGTPRTALVRATPDSPLDRQCFSTVVGLGFHLIQHTTHQSSALSPDFTQNAAGNNPFSSMNNSNITSSPGEAAHQKLHFCTPTKPKLRTSRGIPIPTNTPGSCPCSISAVVRGKKSGDCDGSLGLGGSLSRGVGSLDMCLGGSLPPSFSYLPSVSSSCPSSGATVTLAWSGTKENVRITGASGGGCDGVYSPGATALTGVSSYAHTPLRSIMQMRDRLAGSPAGCGEKSGAEQDNINHSGEHESGCGSGGVGESGCGSGGVGESGCGSGGSSESGCGSGGVGESGCGSGGVGESGCGSGGVGESDTPCSMLDILTAHTSASKHVRIHNNDASRCRHADSRDLSEQREIGKSSTNTDATSGRPKTTTTVIPISSSSLMLQLEEAFDVETHCDDGGHDDNNYIAEKGNTGDSADDSDRDHDSDSDVCSFSRYSMDLSMSVSVMRCDGSCDSDSDSFCDSDKNSYECASNRNCEADSAYKTEARKKPQLLSRHRNKSSRCRVDSDTADLASTHDYLFMNLTTADYTEAETDTECETETEIDTEVTRVESCADPGNSTNQKWLDERAGGIAGTLATSPIENSPHLFEHQHIHVKKQQAQELAVLRSARGKAVDQLIAGIAYREYGWETLACLFSCRVRLHQLLQCTQTVRQEEAQKVHGEDLETGVVVFPIAMLLQLGRCSNDGGSVDGAGRESGRGEAMGPRPDLNTIPLPLPASAVAWAAAHRRCIYTVENCPPLCVSLLTNILDCMASLREAIATQMSAARELSVLRKRKQSVKTRLSALYVQQEEYLYSTRDLLLSTTCHGREGLDRSNEVTGSTTSSGRGYLSIPSANVPLFDVTLE